jgi:tetratricopeptide (TPR) repeat protein
MMPSSDGRAGNQRPLRTLVDAGRFREALSHYFESSDSSGSATPQCRLLAAQAAARLGEFEVSARLTASARQEFEVVDDVDGILESSNLLGAIAFERGKIKDAERHFTAVASLAETHGRARFAARSANNLGSIASLRGNSVPACALYQRALEVYELVGDMRGIAETCHNLSLGLRESGALDAARESSGRAVRTAEQVGDPGLIALALLGRAELNIDSESYDEALDDIGRAELLAWAEGNEPHRLEAERLYALVALRRGDPTEAHRRASIVQARASEAQFALLAAEGKSLAALALKALGRHTEAVGAREAATVAFRSLGATGYLARLSREWESI